MKREPFYTGVVVTKIKGGKNSLWQARKADSFFNRHITGAGNTADNAIKDLQDQIRRCSFTNDPSDKQTSG
jgi:hypothetical protein